MHDDDLLRPRLSPAPATRALTKHAIPAAIIAVALGVSGCETGPGTSDGGPGVHDAGIAVYDAGLGDAYIVGLADAGPPVYDAGIAPPDSGPITEEDASAEPDAGTPAD